MYQRRAVKRGGKRDIQAEFARAGAGPHFAIMLEIRKQHMRALIDAKQVRLEFPH